MKPEILIDGYWLSSIMPWGDLSWVTCWPGGTESITFGVVRNHPLFRPGARVELRYGGVPIALGGMVKPTRGEPLMAEGLHRLGEEYPALNSLFEPSDDVNDAIGQASTRGLPWVRIMDLWPQPGVESAPALDTDQVHSVAQFLDASARERGLQWGVSPYGEVFMAGWHTDPSYHLLPGVDGLAISRDGYASVLWARFLNSATSLFETVVAQDLVAEARWGRVERTITEPLGDGLPMTSARAQALVDGIMAAGRSQMGWASPLEVQSGDVVNEHGRSVDLNWMSAREVVRLHGLTLDAGDLSGRAWVDMPIARTHHRDGVVTIEPRGLSSPMNDALAGVAA